MLCPRGEAPNYRSARCMRRAHPASERGVQATLVTVGVGTTCARSSLMRLHPLLSRVGSIVVIWLCLMPFSRVQASETITATAHARSGGIDVTAPVKITLE